MKDRIVDVVIRFETLNTITSEKCRINAEQFSINKFVLKMNDFVKQKTHR